MMKKEGFKDDVTIPLSKLNVYSAPGSRYGSGLIRNGGT
jgi:hypothetical protein